MLQVHFNYVSGFSVCLAAKLTVILHSFPQSNLNYRISCFCQVADIVFIEPPYCLLKIAIVLGGY